MRVRLPPEVLSSLSTRNNHKEKEFGRQTALGTDARAKYQPDSQKLSGTSRKENACGGEKERRGSQVGNTMQGIVREPPSAGARAGSGLQGDLAMVPGGDHLRRLLGSRHPS